MKKSALSDILGGLIVLAIGLSFMLATNGIIPWDKWWAYLLTFLGVIFIFDALLRWFNLRERLVGGRFITGIILFCIGFSFILALKNWWPLILIIIGILIIIKGIASQKNKPDNQQSPVK